MIYQKIFIDKQVFMAFLETASKRIILASASPRRKELFKLIFEKFETIISNVEEVTVASTEPNELVIELARRKVYGVAENVEEGIIIGADSVVVLDEEILGKPKDIQAAFKMLSQLSGRYHKVFTGFSILQMPEKKYAESFEETSVKFRKLKGWEIQRYMQVGDPMDKAGAYGIQNEAALFVERIEGCYYNVMGLPVASLFKALSPFLNNSYGDNHD